MERIDERSPSCKSAGGKVARRRRSLFSCTTRTASRGTSTEDVAKERGCDVDQAGYEDARWSPARARARGATSRARGEKAVGDVYRGSRAEMLETQFVGYESLTHEPAKILAMIVDGGQRRARPREGDEVELILDRTPFYAESGGQVGDTRLGRSGGRAAARSWTRTSRGPSSSSTA